MVLKIFISFFKVGLFTFGGGYAMLPVLIDEVVKKRQWFSEDEVLEGYAMAQLSMGIIAINTTTLITARKFSHSLGLVAAFATMFPSIIILTIIGLVLNNVEINAMFYTIFLSIQIGVGVLIGYTLVGLIQKSALNRYGWMLLALVIVLFLGFQFSSLLIVALSIAFSALGGHHL
jgi:chromate transporter